MSAKSSSLYKDVNPDFYKHGIKGFLRGLLLYIVIPIVIYLGTVIWFNINKPPFIPGETITQNGSLYRLSLDNFGLGFFFYNLLFGWLLPVLAILFTLISYKRNKENVVSSRKFVSNLVFTFLSILIFVSMIVLIFITFTGR